MQNQTSDRDAVLEISLRLNRQLSAARSSLSTRADAASVEARIHADLDACLDRLKSIDCTRDEKRRLSQSLWQTAGEMLQRGSLQNHARVKPRGYAGDFELLDKIHRRVCCDDPLGAAMDRYFQQQPAPQAVRRRAEEVARAIVELCRSTHATASVAGVGCGPATEIAEAWRSSSGEQRRRLRVTLLDVDPAALEFAQRRLAPLLAGSLRCDRVNVAKPGRHKTWARVREEFDLVYCPGVLDYLDAGGAAELLRLFWQWLKPGGKLLAYNFAPTNPSRAYMEWIGDWYLEYRDAAQMQSVIEAAELHPKRCRISPMCRGAAVTAEIDKPGR